MLLWPVQARVPVWAQRRTLTLAGATADEEPQLPTEDRVWPAQTLSEGQCLPLQYRHPDLSWVLVPAVQRWH